MGATMQAVPIAAGHERDAQAFPILSPEASARLAGYGTPETVTEGSILFERGAWGTDFFLVIAGNIEIVDDGAPGSPIVVMHREGQFSGEIGLFSDRKILVTGRAGCESRLVRLTPIQFRRAMSGEPDVAEIVMRAFILRRMNLIRDSRGGVLLIGPGRGADTLRLQRFLTRNNHPHRVFDTDAESAAAAFLESFGLAEADLPVLVSSDGTLRNPTIGAVADALGLSVRSAEGHVYDVAVVGAGPAGLAAAVYAASEGLDTIVIEANAPGGQAGTSSKIENYLGFPTGISGQALAGRALVQAQKFGAHFAVARDVVGIDCQTLPFVLRTAESGAVRANSVIVATGARYRKLNVADCARFEGQGIHYAATSMEAHLCADGEVVVVGGGNSAGQAAMYLSRVASHVHLLVRADGLAATMSDYLVQRIEASPRITLHARTEIVALGGDRYLREVTWMVRGTGATETRPVADVFVMIGADPNSEWLGDCLDLDAKGFVLTGARTDPNADPLQTSRSGIYAVGDVRSGSVKRVASGVGEGSVVVHAVHGYLASLIGPASER